MAGSDRQVYSPIEPNDILALRAASQGAPIGTDVPLVKWLLLNGWATVSRQPVIQFPPEWMPHWSRQTSGYSVFCSTRDAAALQAKVADSNALIVGAGGAGCNIIQELLGMGVRRFTIVDPDRVEQSNLNRQVLYSPSNIGELKVLAAANEIDRRTGGTASVSCISKNFLDWNPRHSDLQVFDLAVVSADHPLSKIRQHAAALLFPAQVPYAFTGYAGSVVAIGPVVFSREAGCGSCTAFCVSLEDYAFPIEGVGLPFIPPSSCAVNAILGGIFVDKWTRWLAGKGSGSGMWSFDIGTGMTEYFPACQLSACPVCGK
jgi:hypothetical protein